MLSIYLDKFIYNGFASTQFGDIGFNYDNFINNAGDRLVS